MNETERSSVDPFSGLSAAEVQKLAAEAGADRPVTAVRVVGGRVELHLLGGTVTSLTPQDATIEHGKKPLPTPDPLADLTVAQLHYVASQLNLTGYQKLKKADLVQLLHDSFTDKQLVEVIQS